MKTKQNHTFLTWAVAVVIFCQDSAVIAQNKVDHSSDFALSAMAERSLTVTERLEDLRLRHERAFSELSTILKRLPQDPSLLGTKELFAEIDDSVREMKEIRGLCTSLMSSIRAESQLIKTSTAFNEEQKSELQEAASALADGCGTLASKLDLAIKRLGAAYTILPRWNRIHKSYRNLQGQDKAAQQVKIQVDDYLESFTPEAAPMTEEPAEQEDAEQ